MYFGAENIAVSYGKKQILKNVNLTIEKEKTTAIIGLNGSGKSTLLKALGRLIKFEGEVLFEDKPLSARTDRQIAQILALLPQSVQAPADITVLELVSLGRFPHQKLFQQGLSSEDNTFVEQVMRETKVWEMRDTKVSSLSGGQRQRAFISMILAQNSEIILLDEPTTYLDLVHQLDILSLLKELTNHHKKTVVYVIHDLNHAARFADNLVLLKAGEVIAEGTVEKLFTEVQLKECFGLEVTLGTDSFTKSLMIAGVKGG
ncbi:MAG TPA: ABC transporter ATP-binding protein [Lactovum miscens]|uniref:ABC transporter ATP-binding protein n=1 Tax=Lactovum miscens TaxID=190387 RepID=UPI002ED8F631